MKWLLAVVALFAIALSATAQQVADDVSPVVVEAQVDAVEKASTGLWIAIGPDMQLLPTGTYRFIFVPSDSSSNVEVTTITTGTGSPGPTPPPVGDLATKTAAALSKVTATDKKATANTLVTIFEETNKSIADGKLTDQTQVASAIKMVLGFAASGRAGWESFVALASDTLASSPSIQSTSASLKIFIAELKKL